MLVIQLARLWLAQRPPGSFATAALEQSFGGAGTGGIPGLDSVNLSPGHGGSPEAPPSSNTPRARQHGGGSTPQHYHPPSLTPPGRHQHPRPATQVHPRHAPAHAVRASGSDVSPHAFAGGRGAAMPATLPAKPHVSNVFPKHGRHGETKFGMPAAVSPSTVGPFLPAPQTGLDPNMPGVSHHPLPPPLPSHAPDTPHQMPPLPSQATGAPSGGATPRHIGPTGSTTRPFTGPNADFINRIRPAARAASARTGIDWRIIAAQAAHESAHGRRTPGNMVFGVKAGRGYQGETQTLRTHEVVGGRSVATRAKFRKYSSVEDSVKDYAKVMGGKLGRGVREAHGLENQLDALGRSGYATDPHYREKIGRIASGLGTPDPTTPLNQGTPARMPEDPKLAAAARLAAARASLARRSRP